jgi:hypothetical protein
MRGRATGRCSEEAVSWAYQNVYSKSRVAAATGTPRLHTKKILRLHVLPVDGMRRQQPDAATSKSSCCHQLHSAVHYRSGTAIETAVFRAEDERERNKRSRHLKIPQWLLLVTLGIERMFRMVTLARRLGPFHAEMLADAYVPNCLLGCLLASCTRSPFPCHAAAKRVGISA